MPDRLSRRAFLGRTLAAALPLSVAVASGEAARKGLDLLDQHNTWSDAARPNDAFLAAHAAGLARLTLGGSFAPEQWPLDPEGQRQALAGLDLAVRELGLHQLRLGFRWRRSVDSAGAIDLSAYAPLLDYCLSSGVNLCLNLGPIRTFRWPEEHVPAEVLDRLPKLPPAGGSIAPDDPLAQAAIDYLDRLLLALRRDYSDLSRNLRAVQIENEPFYPLGEHRWRLRPDYLEVVARRVNDAFPYASLLFTSAGRLNLKDLRDLFVRLVARRPAFTGRLISGFDYHYKTPRRDSIPVIRYFDQIAYARPLAQGSDGHIRDARALFFRIEVTEGQAEPYGRFTSPGNSAKEFRFMILRCLDKVLDPQEPGLIRIWGVEELTKKMLAGTLTPEHLQIVELIQTINAQPTEGRLRYAVGASR